MNLLLLTLPTRHWVRHSLLTCALVLVPKQNDCLCSINATDEENDEDEDDDDATYGESASHRAIPDLESTPTLDDFHNSESDAPSSYSSKHARQAAVSGAGHDFSIKGKGGSRKPPKKKGRTATTEDSLINFGGGMDKEDSAPSVDKQKVDAHRASLSHVEENNLKWKSELATTKSKRSK